MKNILLFSIIIGLMACSGSDEKTKCPSYDKNGITLNIPKLSTIVVDGAIDDWKDKGSTVNLYSDYIGNTIHSNDFSASFSLGWNDTALFVSATVIDDTLFSEDKKKSDALELFLIENIRGKNKVQYIITPNFSSMPVTCSIVEWDHRGSRKVAGKPMTIQAAFQKNESVGGYTFEALIPFSIIDLQATTGAEAGFEMMIHDADKESDKNTQVLAWSYVKDAYVNNYALNRMILSEQKEEDVFDTKAYILDGDSLHIVVHAPQSMIGKELCLCDTACICTKTIFEPSSNVAMAKLVLPYAHPAEIPIGLYVEENNIGVIDADITNLEHLNTAVLPHENYIRLIQRRNTLFPVPEKPILFIGHSMFRFWHCFNDDMTGFTAINQAFGGSRSDQVVQYYDILIKPFNPKAIVYFEGGNDFHTGVPVDTFMHNVKIFAERVHVDFPQIKIFMLSPDIRDEQPDYNEKLKAFIAQHSDYIEYVNLEGMKRKIGAKYQDILLPDNSHWNASGYEIITSMIRETLKEYMD